MAHRARPPADIPPADFFVHWVPAAVSGDLERRRQLGDARMTIHFELLGDDGGDFLVRVEQGEVRGAPGRPPEPDLHVRLDVATWRELNRGDLSAPEAVVRRRLSVRGNLLLAIKLHLILG